MHSFSFIKIINSGLLIQPMPFERLKCMGHLKRIKQRINEEERLKHLANQSQSQTQH